MQINLVTHLTRLESPSTLLRDLKDAQP